MLLRDQDNARGLADSLEALSWVAAARGQAKRAALLLGATETLREMSGSMRFGLWQSDHEHARATVRAALGPAVYETVRLAGRAMPLEEAVAFGLATEGEPGPEAVDGLGEAGASPDRTPLTPRECQVAALVARGLTNRQIAAELVITEGTVAIHVGNILRKLGLRSRTGVAAWTIRQGLAELPSS